jgi:predicted exporter
VKSNRRWLALLFGIPVLLGLWRLRFDTDILNLLPDDLPSVTGLKLYQRHFSNNREVVITVTADSAEASESAARSIAEKLRAATNLVADAVWQPPWMDHPEETAEFIAWLWLSRPTSDVDALRKRLDPGNAPAVLNETRERLATSLSPLDLARLSHDPFGLSNLGGGLNQNQDWFASPDGKFRLIFVQPRTAPTRFEDWAVWLDQVRALAKSDTAKIAFTGAPVFFVETALGMKGDMMQSIVSTILLVGALFWWAHRRFWPLLWMLTMLVSSLLVTMAIGGLIFGSLNVVSFGFAAILLGLGVDYALVVYQELLGAPNESAAHVRADAAPGIWWSAGTTALAFVLLNFAGLPGLGQLGTLVAVGVMIAAGAMLHGFLPMMTRRPPTRKTEVNASASPALDRFAWPATVVVGILGAVILLRAWPGIDRSAQPLGSVNSEAARAAKEIDERINHGTETIWLIAQGRDEGEVRSRLQAASEQLKNVRTELPLEIWPRPDLQKQNLAA